MKKLRVTVEGKTYDVMVEEINEEEHNDVNMDNKDLNINKSSNNHINNKEDKKAEMLNSGEPVKAPMPGTIVSVNIKQGQKVKKGDILIILEAMKMENEITAPRDAEISAIDVKKGDSVESGANLLFLK